MSVLEAIGNTSMVRLRKVVPSGCADIFVKLEWENPTGSVKDRMAQSVIAHAEADGRLKPGDTVVEYTVRPPLFDSTVVDQIVPVGSDDAKSMARRIAHEEALFAGTSSGANVLAAIEVAQRLGAGAKVVTLMVDSGLKYLGTDVYRGR